MATQPILRPIAEQEYLALDRVADRRSEYHDGQMFLMSGASNEHNLIVGEVIRNIGNTLVNSPCNVYPSDMRIQIPGRRNYVYPDVSVVCAEPQFDDKRSEILLNPNLIIEVLSPSTQHFDRGKKFDLYRSIPSVQEYVLVAQDEPRVAVYQRRANEEWAFTEAEGLKGKIRLYSVGCDLGLKEIYRKIVFEQ